MSHQFVSGRKDWSKQPPRPQIGAGARDSASGDQKPARPISNSTGNATSLRAKKDGQYYVGPHGEVRVFSDGGEDKLVYAPKGFPTTQTKRLADTRDKRREMNRLKLLIRMRDLVRDIQDLQVEYSDDAVAAMDAPPWAAAQKELRQTYDVFFRTYGALNEFEMRQTGKLRDDGAPISYKFYSNLRKFRHDPDAYLLASIEEYDHLTGDVTLDPIFSERVVRARRDNLKAETLSDAILMSYDQKGAMDFPYMAELYGEPDEESLVRKLRQQNLVFFDPEMNEWGDAPSYLCGNISAKIKAVEEAIDDMPELARNLKALEKVLPEDLPPEDIRVSLGMHWIPADIIEDFAREVLQVQKVDVAYFGKKHLWFVHGDEADPFAGSRSEYGTEFVHPLRVLRAALNGRTVSVSRTKDRYGNPIDKTMETEIARDNQARLEERFSEWIWQDPARRERVARLYNERFNALVPREDFDGSRLSLPGSSLSVELRPHQRRAIWRNLVQGNSLYEHATGSGKTYTAIAAAMKLIAMGKVEKPLLNVPNQMVGEFARAFRKFYPHANVLVIEPDEMIEGSGGLSLQEKMQQVQDRIRKHNGPVIMSHANYDRFEITPQTRLERMLGEIRDAQGLIDRLGPGKETRKLYDKAVQNCANYLLSAYETEDETLRAALCSIAENITADVGRWVEAHYQEGADSAVWAPFLEALVDQDVMNFEMTGIDYVFTDEGHGYKNMDITSRFEGLSNKGSAKTTKYEEKLYVLRQKNPHFHHTLMTWTPISNSIAEAYTMQYMLDLPMLRNAGFECFDAWAHMFCRSSENYEIAPEGGYRLIERVAEYQNLPELIRMYLQVADIVDDEMLDIEKPEIKGGKPGTVIIPQYPALEAYFDGLRERMNKVHLGAVSMDKDNPLKIMNDGIVAALHPPLKGIDAPEGVKTKVDYIADEVAARFHENKDNIYYAEDGSPDQNRGALQMILSDIGVQKSADEESFYGILKEKLVERGIPASKIQFIHDHESSAKEREIQRKCNEGEVAVIIGTTAKLGTGKNVQKRLIALHQAMMLWRPSDDDQGQGRIDRQGNQNKIVEILRYIVENSPDGYRWQTLARKSRFISQIKAKDLDTREAPESEKTLGYNEVVAAILNDPLMFENVETAQALSRLARAKEAHKSQAKRARKSLPLIKKDIAALETEVKHLRPIFAAVTEHRQAGTRFVLGDKSYETDATAGAALKEKLRIVRDDLRQKRKMTVPDFGYLYGYPVKLMAQSEGENGNYKYQFVLKVDALEGIEITLNANDIRKTEAERLLGHYQNGEAEALKKQGFDAAQAEADVAALDGALIDKLRVPFARAEAEIKEADRELARLTDEQARLSDVAKRSFALEHELKRLKDRKKQIDKTLKKRAKEQDVAAPLIPVAI